MKKADRLPGVKTESAATDAEKAKKVYEKAELTIHGELKELTGGES